MKPKTYNRYVDDTFGSFKDIKHILELKAKFEENSCLKFTYEVEKDHIINFLDIQITREQNSYSTAIHVKETNNGQCHNYKSICPMRYKEGVIKTLLHRA